jgi:hypothetical protein
MDRRGAPASGCLLRRAPHANPRHPLPEQSDSDGASEFQEPADPTERVQEIIERAVGAIVRGGGVVWSGGVCGGLAAPP